MSTFADQAVIAIENVRLFEEVQARTAELQESLDYQTATSDVLNVISRSPTALQPVFDTIVETAGRLCEADFAFAFRLRDDGRFHLAAADPALPKLVDFLAAHPISPGDGSLTGRVAIEKQTLHVPDATLDPEYLWTKWLEVSGFRTFLSVPLMHEGAVTGVIALARGEVKPFSERQIDLVTTFADQAVIAINNVRLFEEVQAKTTELQETLEYQTATSEVLNVISRSPSALEPVLDAIAQTAGRLCESYDTLIILREGDWLKPSAHAGPLSIGFEKKRVSRSWVTGRAVADCRPVHVHDFMAVKDEFPDSQPMNVPVGLRTMLAIPLLRDNAAIGAIVIRRTEVRPFSDRQVAILQTFADQAVIAIENVRLFQEVQARTREIEESLQQQTATAEVLKVISRSAFDLPTVLHTLVESAARLCNAEKATITRQIDGKFYRAEAFGFSSLFMERVRNIPVEPERGSVSGRALLEGKTVHISDITADPEYSFAPDAQSFDSFRTALGVPMLREGVPIGVMVLTRSEVMPFTEKQIELVTTFADQAAIAIENARLFSELQMRTEELSRSLQELTAAQNRLVQTEKLASLGQLTAGIAHEIKNPLNFINNFSALSAELTQELEVLLRNAEIHGELRAEVTELMRMLNGNLEKVVQHGRRADSIVKNMLLHSRQSSGEHRSADINAVVEESLNLAYHGARAAQQGFNIALEKSFDPNAGEVDLYPQEITRVLLNLISNGFYATSKRASSGENGYEPTLTTSTKDLGDRVEIRIRDNGTGIPPNVRAKIFEPFFTTKPAGEGTGLGLSLSHEIIVKQHAGAIEVESEPGKYTEFRVILPRGAATIAKAGGSA